MRVVSSVYEGCLRSKVATFRACHRALMVILTKYKIKEEIRRSRCDQDKPWPSRIVEGSSLIEENFEIHCDTHPQTEGA